MGVEEELLLVDRDSGVVRPVSHHALAAHRERVGPAADRDGHGAESGVDQELFREQLETGTTPCTTSTELLTAITACRREAAAAAERAGVALVAAGSPILAETPERVTAKPRYERIVEEFGEIGRQASVCGMHVHVEVDGPEEGVRVLDGLRPWLPVLRAMSVNSPFWHGRDTGYASWRTQVWARFPSAGPTEPFGDRSGYEAATRALVDSGAALDTAMLYFDARLAQRYPTVEVRVCDVMVEPGDTVLLAILTRALVATLASAERSASGTVPGPARWRTELLRAAHWRASRYGLASDLLDPMTTHRRPARDVVETLLRYAAPGLEAADEAEEARQRFEELMARGTGAARQRAVAEADGLEAVVRHLRERFEASYA
jgi:carboxylate-amine ligase